MSLAYRNAPIVKICLVINKGVIDKEREGGLCFLVTHQGHDDAELVLPCRWRQSRSFLALGLLFIQVLIDRALGRGGLGKPIELEHPAAVSTMLETLYRGVSYPFVKCFGVGINVQGHEYARVLELLASEHGRVTDHLGEVEVSAALGDGELNDFVLIAPDDLPALREGRRLLEDRFAVSLRERREGKAKPRVS